MLGLLLLLGFTFFTFANQENTSSEFFSEAAKEAETISSEVLFDYGLEQVLLGARTDRPNSVLYSGAPLGRHSLVVNMLGNDIAPFTGEGVNVVHRDYGRDTDADGNVDSSEDYPNTLPDGIPDRLPSGDLPWGADLDGDGKPDPFASADLNPLNFNYGAMANPVTSGQARNPSTNLPAPDVGYTYPDINNLFLAFYGTTWDAANGRWRRYVIPSFHRPQYMRDQTTGQRLSNWATDSNTGARVFRPHPNHTVKASPTSAGGTTRSRYITGSEPAPLDALGSPIGPFPMTVNKNGTTLRQGIFDAADGSAVALNNAEFTNVGTADATDAIAYDTDNDNDGIYEGVWLDLDFPIQRLADGRLYAVMHSFTIIDADGLINLNEAGNLSGAGPSPAEVLKGNLLSPSELGLVSQSNLGMSPSEINPQFAMSANPYSVGAKGDFATQADANTALDPLRLMWNLPGGINSGTFPYDTTGLNPSQLNRFNVANFELAMLLMGRTTYRAQSGGGYTLNGNDYTLADVVAGRWGEANWLRLAAWEAGTGSYSSYPQSLRFTNTNNFANGLGFLFPRPGNSNHDINLLQQYLASNPNARFSPWTGWAFVPGSSTSRPANYDDNFNRFALDPRLTGDSWLPNIQIPLGRQPVDLRGTGSYVDIGTMASGYGPQMNRLPVVGANPLIRWMSYTGYGSPRDSSGTIPALEWETVAPAGVGAGGLSSSVTEAGTVDEPSETVTEPRYARNRGDEIFGIDAMAGLHLRENEGIALSANEERLRQLAPFNFGAANTRDKQFLNSTDTTAWPKGIRDRFTVSSWDRSQFALTFRTELGPDGKPGFAGVNDDMDMEVDEYDEYRPPPMDFGDDNPGNARPWESTYPDGGYAPTPNSFREFPPRFGGDVTFGAGNFTVMQPFRDDVRQFLRYRLNYVPQQGQLADLTSRLQLNRLALSRYNDQLQRVTPFFRRLMPHPTSLPSRQVPDASTIRGADGLYGRPGVDDNGNGITDGTATVPDYGELGSFGYEGTNSTSYSDDLMPWSVYTSGSHPRGISQATWPGGSVPPEAEARPLIQEFWARRDRQQLARDLYVLLYTLGGGRNLAEFNAPSLGIGNRGYLADNTAFAVFSEEQLREMAQFAVNYIDSMDADDVITRFEYDVNLGNGWNLDDNAYTTSGDVFPDGSSASTSERRVVHGVEAQTMTLSEVLSVTTKPAATDDANRTSYNDTLRHFFGYVELRNVAPRNIALNNGGWRLRIQRAGAGAGQWVDNRTLHLVNAGTVTGGGQFVIAARTGNDQVAGVERPSVFRVNVDGDATPTFDSIAPPNAPSGTPTGVEPAIPQIQLDLRTSPGTTHQLGTGVLTPLMTTLSGGELFFDPGEVAFPAVRVVLERRLHTNRSRPTSNAEDDDNPWVEVDDIANIVTIEYDVEDSNVAGQLNNLRSKERRHPFAANEQDGMQIPAAALSNPAVVAFNSIGQTYNTWTDADQNGVVDASVTETAITQVHFDRDFVSVGELMTLPLFGPAEVTDNLARSRNMNSQPPRIGTPAKPTGTELTAAKKFLRSDYITTDGLSNVGITPDPDTNALLDNRWHRLLEFVEVPNGRNSQVQTFLQSARTPGKLNLNTIREASVLAGLLDDSMLVGCVNPFLEGAGNADNGYRYWWPQFLKSRDRRDPLTGLYLAGTANSRPFRPLSDLGTQPLVRTDMANEIVGSDVRDSSVERTLLRTMPWNRATPTTPPYFDDLDIDGSGYPLLDRRQLFEARNLADLGTVSGTSGNNVDTHTRHRMLHKIANNSTTRSNVYIVWASVGFFKAYYDTTAQVYRIGEELDPTEFPRQRAFFVLDRSEYERAYDARTGTFNFRKFIKYRKTLQE